MKKVKAKLIAFAILCTLTSLAFSGSISVVEPESAGMSAKKLELVSGAVQKLVDKDKVAGASVLVSYNDKVVYLNTFGMMDKEAKKPIKEDTIFRFYSMSKPITSVAVMMLYEEGKIDLDAPVSKYIKSFKGLKVYEEDGNVEPEREMTVRDQLRHTAGLTYGYFGNTEVDKQYRNVSILDKDSSLDEMAEKLSKIPLLYQPGKVWHYSVAVDVLGYLVEVVSGQKLDDFFEERIFTPLGMDDTGFYVPKDKQDRFATCYNSTLLSGLTKSTDPATNSYFTDPGLLSGGGGLVSTIGDYLSFCRMLLNKGELNGKRLLKAETVEMMTCNQLPDNVHWGSDGFGLGFSVRTSEGKYGPGEYGWGGAASTHFWIHPEHKLIVIALSQLKPYSTQLENTIKPLIYEAIIE